MIDIPTPPKAAPLASVVLPVTLNKAGRAMFLVTLELTANAPLAKLMLP